MQVITKQTAEDTVSAPAEQASISAVQKIDDNSLVELAHALHNIDLAGPEAELNSTTISDNNGGRIVL